MAIAPRLHSLAGKWQVPLLAISVGLFVTGLLQLRPSVPKPTFQDYLREARVALQAERFDQASLVLTSVLNNQQDLSDPQRAIAHRALAETIWMAESTKITHEPENARRILSNFDIAAKLGDAPQDADYEKIAQAADWMGDSDEALASYEKALEEEGVDRVAVLQRVVEILLTQEKRDWPRIDTYVDLLLAEAADTPETLLVALQLKMQRLLASDDIQGAKALLQRVQTRLDVPPWSYHLQYFQAQILFREEQFEAAEARLRALQANLRRGHPLYAQAGWLLGRINYIEHRPDIALSFYDEVVRTHAGTEYWLASLLGKAESLAGLERYAASADAYQHVIEAMQKSQRSLLLDEQAIRESLYTLATVLSQQGRPGEALPFVQTAIQLVPQGQTDSLATLTEREARIHMQAGADLLRKSKNAEPVAAAPADPAPTAHGEPSPDLEAVASAPATQDAAADSKTRGRDHYFQAGELLARLTKLRILDSERSEEADWESARCFELSARPDRSVEALQGFISRRPKSPLTPEAMQRLGAAQQLRGRTDDAITVYEALMDKFTRTPPALASLVPLARSYMSYGIKGFDRAEKILLSVVEVDPSKPGIFDPAASEFHDALIDLAELYMRWDKPERAIERLEQTLSLYPDDLENTRLEYQLADAYRSSGLALQARARDASTSHPEGLLTEAHRRLNRARELFDRVVGRLDTATAALGPADLVYLKTSYVYRADCAFDIGKYVEAADLYGRVAWRWQYDPVALASYVQIVRSYMAAGDMEAARSALARARWILRRIPDTQFNQPPDFRSRAYWTLLFDWVENSGLLAKGNS